jgi:hypothetical protein
MPTTALNHTTTIGTEKTVGEIHRLLALAGASHVATRYGPDAIPAAVTFVIGVDDAARPFQLPVNVEAMREFLRREQRAGRIRSYPKGGLQTFLSEQHAARVAWRVAKDWLEAQLAIVGAGQAALDQVMLPYLLLDPNDGTTLYDRYLDNDRRALTMGEPS